MVKPTNCKFVSSPGAANGTIEWPPDLPGLAVEASGLPYDERSENTNGEIATLDIEKTEGSGKACGVLPLVNTVVGSALAKINNGAKEFEFEGESGTKPLSIDGLAAHYEGSEKSTAFP